MNEAKMVLVVCPIAVGASWRRQIEAMRLGLEPWDHQHKAGGWASSRRASMLAMDMGTGKTLTAMLAIGVGGDASPVVLVEGSTNERLKTLRQERLRNPGADLVVVVNYDSVWRGDFGKAIGATKWAAIILDESHRIKSPGGRASRWLASLARANPQAKLLCLTGTPMPHSPLDLYGQFRFLDPEVFGTSYSRFRARYADTHRVFPSKVLRWIRQPELTAKLDANAWRVAADDVLDLPDALHETVRVKLSPRTLKFYRDLETEMVGELEHGAVTAANALTKLLRLQQATSGYATVDCEDGKMPPSLIDGVPAKRSALTEWLSDLPISEPVVVFCRFRTDLQEVAAVCGEAGRTYSQLSGGRNELAAWQAGGSDVIGVQMQCGGVGVDLTRAAYCAYYSMGYSLGDYEQSLARMRRPGQTRCCRYYHFVCEGTVDEQVYEALRQRKSVVESVMEQMSTRATKGERGQ